MTYKSGSYYKNKDSEIEYEHNTEHFVSCDNDNKFDPKRVGIITASNLHKIITITEDKITKTAETYLKTLVSQTMLVEDKDIVKYQCWDKGKSFPMKRGNDMEPEAIKYIGENLIPDLGIVTDGRGDIRKAESGIVFGATPDAYIFDNGEPAGLLEVKCPDSITLHIDRMISGVPKEYYWQCIGQLIVEESANYVLFVSYHPHIKVDHRTISHYIVRSEVQKDIDKAINAIRLGNIYINKLKDDIINFSTQEI